MKKHLVAAIVIAQLAGACASAPSPLPTTTAVAATQTSTSTGTTASPTASPTARPSAAPTALPPTSPPTLPDPAFTTRRATTTGDSWTGLDWRRLDPSDPIVNIRTIRAWSGGFIALGAPAGDGRAVHTPVWTSADGANWTPVHLPFGPGAITSNIVEVHGVLATITLQGTDTSDCERLRFTRCVGLDGPLRAWSSTNGRDWLEGVAPAVILPGHEPYELDMHELVAAGNALALGRDGDAIWAGVSADGVDWEPVGAALPPGLDTMPGAIEALRSRLVAIGTEGQGKGTRAALFETQDGTSWTTIRLETTIDGTTFGLRLVAAADGLVAIGRAGGVPAPYLWWGRPDGRHWESLSDYPPLGTWLGPELGHGLGPNGTLVGDGQRMLAYGADDKPRAWISTDGTTWTRLAISGRAPDTEGQPDVGTFILTSLGVLFFGDGGSAWFADPLVD